VVNRTVTALEQTPATDVHNADLLDLIPQSANKLVEVGCSTGALARAYKAKNPKSKYIGIEVEPSYAEQARAFCDTCVVGNIEEFESDFWKAQGDTDCWIFGDVLEHLKDPWLTLEHIRQVIPRDGCVVACIPNAQHWSLQVRLSVGDFRYEDSGLLDRTHLRWFTRQTMIELFQQTGFQITEGKPRVLKEAHRDKFIPLIGQLAKEGGADPEIAMRDAIPFQFVIRANPLETEDR
jgi:SAM-dependent methyltransferase